MTVILLTVCSVLSDLSSLLGGCGVTEDEAGCSRGCRGSAITTQGVITRGDSQSSSPVLLPPEYEPRSGEDLLDSRCVCNLWEGLIVDFIDH